MRQDEFYLFQQDFFKQLDTKTGWGKEKVKEAFIETIHKTGLLEPNTDTKLHLIKELFTLEAQIKELHKKFAEVSE